jgi:hypothetical protein
MKKLEEGKLIIFKCDEEETRTQYWKRNEEGL